MSLQVMRAMIELGLTDQQKLVILAAMEADAQPVRSAAAIRQKRYRDNKRDNKRDVTRDVTRSPYEDTSTPSEVVTGEASPHISRAPAQPVSEAQAIWNEEAAEAGWPLVETLNSTRTRSASARLREVGIDGWRAALCRARSSPYLGRDPPSWFTFDWVIKSTNFLKLTEGNYDRRLEQNRNGVGSVGRPGPSALLQIRQSAAAAVARGYAGDG